MDDLSLNTLIHGKIAQANSSYGRDSAWQAERLKAEKYYKGKPRGDEQEGRSQVVSRDVAETVDSIMPSLMRIFTSGDKVVEFQPTGPEDEEGAEQATDYVNWIWLQQNPGFRIMHDWFKDGLLHRLGVIKVWWDTTPTKTTERYHNLNEEELRLIASDPDVDIVSQQEAGMMEVPGGIDPQTGEQLPSTQAPLFNVRVQLKDGKGRIRIVPVPPEEFVVESRTKSLELDDLKFVAHKMDRTISDLLDEGYPQEVIDDIGSNEDLRITQENLERHSDESQMPFGDSDVNDPSLRRVTVYECYLKVDYDGDGIAELRKVTVAGNVILDNEEVDDHPFVALTPKLMQHKLIGRSIADELYDIQDIKTTLWRQMLDNIYLANNNRTIVVENQVNLDDLLTVRPGGIIRVKQGAGAIQPFPFQGIVRDAYQLIEYSDTVRENRVGVTRYNQGLDANTLNKTATGITQIMDAARQRQELIARTYAESVAVAFKKILRLVCQYQDYEKVIRLRGKYVVMDPRGWKSGYDTSISVGLGTGNRDQQAVRMMQLIELDKGLLELQAATGETLVSPKNIYNKLVKVIEAFGLKSPDPYYTDPNGDEAEAKKQEQAQAASEQAQQPPPEQQALEAEMQRIQQKAQAEIEVMFAKARADIQIKMQAAQADIEIKKLEIANKLQQQAVGALGGNIG